MEVTSRDLVTCMGRVDCAYNSVLRTYKLPCLVTIDHASPPQDASTPPVTRWNLLERVAYWFLEESQSSQVNTFPVVLSLTQHCSALIVTG